MLHAEIAQESLAAPLQILHLNIFLSTFYPFPNAKAIGKARMIFFIKKWLAARRGQTKTRCWTMRWWRIQDKAIIALFARKDETIGCVLRRV
jgi:hypothetical protein